MRDKLKKVGLIILEYVKEHAFVLIACSAFIYFFFALETHHSPYFKKAELYELGTKVLVVFGIALYFLGHKKAKESMITERNARAQCCYGWAKSAFEVKDYVEAIAKSAEAVGATSGLHQIIDCSSEHHLLAVALGSMKHDSATQEHEYSAWYAADDNPSKTLYYFHASVSHLNKKNYEFAVMRAESGLYFIEKHPPARFNENYDFGTEFRMIKLLSSFMGTPGTKAFESYKEDAEWIVKNSKDTVKARFAKNYLSMPGKINDVANNIMKDYLREGADQN